MCIRDRSSFFFVAASCFCFINIPVYHIGVQRLVRVCALIWYLLFVKEQKFSAAVNTFYRLVYITHTHTHTHKREQKSDTNVKILERWFLLTKNRPSSGFSTICEPILWDMRKCAKNAPQTIVTNAEHFPKHSRVVLLNRSLFPKVQFPGLKPIFLTLPPWVMPLPNIILKLT